MYLHGGLELLGCAALRLPIAALLDERLAAHLSLAIARKGLPRALHRHCSFRCRASPSQNYSGTFLLNQSDSSRAALRLPVDALLDNCLASLLLPIPRKGLLRSLPTHALPGVTDRQFPVPVQEEVTA